MRRLRCLREVKKQFSKIIRYYTVNEKKKKQENDTIQNNTLPIVILVTLTIKGIYRIGISHCHMNHEERHNCSPLVKL